MSVLYRSILIVFTTIFIGNLTVKSQSIDSNINNIEKVQSNQEKDNGIKTIKSIGYGSSIKNAAQNAAENALNETVGLFIDSEILIKKRKVIKNNIINRSKKIHIDINNYSQGSIKSFKLLDASKIGSEYKVNAIVEIRVNQLESLRNTQNVFSQKEEDLSKGLYIENGEINSIEV